MSNATKALIKLVEKSASEQNSSEQAQQLIRQGADIKVPTKNGPMIQSVIAEEKRQRPILVQKANNCLRLIQVLEKAASEQLTAQVLSTNVGNPREMRVLVDLKASCYQSEVYGPLGLLGAFFNQDKISIRSDIVKFLVESDSNVQKSLIINDNHGKNCLSLAKGNSKCPPNVIDYIQQEIDTLVNQTPLIQSSINPNEVIVWIRCGANLEATDQHGNTVLSNAVHVNNLELVRALLSAGSSTMHKNHQGYTPLEMAKRAIPKNPPLINLLQGQNANVELGKLIETRKATLTIEEVQDLLDNGANINASLANGDSPLHLLIVNGGTIDMIKVFINDLNANLSITNNYGHRPIETCILVDKKPFLYLQAILTLPKLTIEQFYNPSMKQTLLQFAIEQKRSDAAKIIQDELNLRLWNCVRQADTNEDNNRAIVETAKQLVAFGAQIDHFHTDPEYDQWTVLHLVSQQTTVVMLQYFITYLKADYTLQNGIGNFPISIAAEFGYFYMVEYLCSLWKGYLNGQNKEMQTPLHLASKNNHLLVVWYLVRWGADHQIQDQSQRTPLDIARENVSKNKEEEINNKKIIQLLVGLVCPPVEQIKGVSLVHKKPTYDLDTCDLPKPVLLKPITESTEDADAMIGRKTKGLFSSSPNDNLFEAARTGDVLLAQKAIGEGADIRYRRSNHTPFEVAMSSFNEYTTKSRTIVSAETAQFRATATRCQQIVQMIQHIAHTKVVEAIQQSNASLVVAYHRAGAPITVHLVYKACNASDNVEIFHYLISQSVDIQKAIMNDFSPNSVYSIVKAKKFNKITMYLKYQLSVECTKAIKENNFVTAKNLVQIGASVDLENTHSLHEAIKHKNHEMVRFLCENGAKMPVEWLSSKAFVLGPEVSQNMKPEIVSTINRYLLERRLRFAAANGDFDEVIYCQRLGVDINSMNCHGSTALLCTIEHGNYFPIVHALVSHGATMLHRNENVQMSLIDIANQFNYKQIADYLFYELNTQFLSAVLYNDRRSAEKFAQLGADFNYKDEQERTALHYAVQYHGIDLVAWLCECGSLPTISDINGDYPILQAVEKGDYAVVELFVTKYPNTKKQTNKQGMTALQIAQKLKFSRIVQLIETGQGAIDSEKDGDDKSNPSKHNEHALVQAVRDGHIKIIREFIAQRYESKQEKKTICQMLINVAKQASQYEVLDALEPYYKTELRTELASDMHAGSNIVLSDRYKKILFGLLGSLNNLIADSDVLLDPSDPNTYKLFFVGLTENVAKQSQQLQEVKTEKDIQILIQKDDLGTKEQLDKIEKQLEQLFENKDILEARVLETDERLFKEQKLTALQRKEFLKEKELHQQQLATYECSIFLFQRQQEATLNRRKAMEFFKNNFNLILFYRTIENRLEALFHSYLAAQGGYLKLANATPAAHIPLINLSTSIIKSVLSPVLSKLNEKQQKKEWYNISTLGNIEELRRIASETAGLVTLYYTEQIQSIDTQQKIKGTNIFNEKVHWLSQIFNVRPESSEEIPVVIVAEYITAWIIDGLKLGTDIDPFEPLPKQLWLHVAKKDPTDIDKIKKTSDIIGLSAGKQKIPVKINENGKVISMQLQLRYLIGCVSVIGINGYIYEYPKTEKNSDNELNQLKYFGYVYVTPFSSDEKTLQTIVEGRRMHLIKSNTYNQLVTQFDDIVEHAQAFTDQDQQVHKKSIITRETAEKIADVLREDKVFVEFNTLTDELTKTQQKIEIDVDILREQIEEKATYYQASIDAAHEQIKEEEEQNRQVMKNDNEQRYHQAMKQLNQRAEQINNNLEELIQNRMNQIEKQLKEETEKILAIAQTANAQSLTAIEKAQQASQTSLQAVQNSEKAANSAEHLTKWSQQLNEQFQLSMQKCEKVTKQTAFEQQQSCEQAISDIRTKAQQNMERSKEAANKSAEDTKESARNAKDSHSIVLDLQKTMKNQLETHKSEIKKMIGEAKESRQESERAANEAKEAQKQATQAANTSSTAIDKINAIQTKVDKSLKDIERLTKT